MSKSIKYLENVSILDDSIPGESIETVSLNEAIVACELQELDTLSKTFAEILPYVPSEKASVILHRIEELNKKLKNIKIK